MDGLLEYSLPICACLWLVSRIECADTSQEIPETSIKHYQTAMMLRCISNNFQVSEAHRDRMWNYLCTGRPNSPDPCEWRGVTCTNNEITSLVFTSTNGVRSPLDSPWSIDMDWLPTTLQYAHLCALRFLNGWLARRLPRKMVYFYSSCSLANDVVTDRQIHFRHLPAKMEEMHIYGGWFAGTILIAGLPNTMRVCVLCSRYIRRAYVENQSLPSTLKKLVIYGNYGKAKVISTHGKLDERVSKNSMDKNIYSDRCKAYKDIARGISHEFNPPRRGLDRTAF